MTVRPAVLGTSTFGTAALGTGAFGLAALALLAAFGSVVMPSYLAAWLFWMALPLGALPLVMLLELLNVRGWTLLPVLRRMLLLLPAGVLLALPVVVSVFLGHGPLAARPGLPAWWVQHPFLLVRMAVLLLVWTGLALLFCRAPRQAPRRGAAVAGLLLHLPMGTVAALDWVMSLDPGLGSSAFGLLLMAAQAGTALCAAVFALALGARGRGLPDEAPPLMAGALLAWVFLHFIQYLVVWSANLPGEIAWYQARSLGLGAPAAWSCAAAAALALALLLPRGLARIPAVVASVAAMLLLAHLVEMLWLVTPAFRGAFSAAWSDGLAVAGLGGLAVFTLAALLGAGRDSVHA